MDAERVLVLKTMDPLEHVDRVASLWQDLRGRDEQLLFKPNLINHRHLLGGDYNAVVTQPDVLELAWRVADTLSLSGPRAVADAPQGDANFETILERTGLAQWGRERGVELVDLRSTRYDERRGISLAVHELPGDPAGPVHINLGKHSRFYGVEGRRYYGAGYDIDYTNRHHSRETHEYAFSGTALRSGIVINLPKLKTHKKAGVTLSLKNLVGLNADKNLLPHHSLGTPSEGGDAYEASRAKTKVESGVLRSVKPLLGKSRLLAEAASLAQPIARKIFGDTHHVVRSGNWWGNDTLWRMIHDLNRILLYARPDGTIANEAQRSCVSLIDGVVAGEGRGPEAPDRVDAGVIIAGSDFVAVDVVAATFMGLDFRKIPHLDHAFDDHALPLTQVDLEKITVESNVAEWNRNLWEIDPSTLFRFRPHFGWVGHIERDPASHVVGPL